jgi:putative membrane protein
MMAYPALLAGRAIARRPLSRVLVGAWALASWDFFLDPQLVADGCWHWTHPSPTLPGVPGVPLSDYAGWILVSLVLMAALDRLLTSAPAVAGVPLTLYQWTFFSSVIANAAFFGRPAVAGYGAIAMGPVAVGWLRTWLR